jgi:transcriptional regulator with XRE-family HTH domain
MRFLSHFDKRIEYVGFDAYIRKLCTSKGIIPKLVIQKAGIAPQYGQQVFSGKCRPKRDIIIQLAFGFELGYKEAQLLLQAAGKKELNRKTKRDAAVVYALTRKSSFEDLQGFLKELQLPLFDNANSSIDI